MNKIIFTLAIFLLSGHSYSQNGLYMVTEVVCLSQINQQPIYDSVYVTDPLGSTTGYSIPIFTNVVAHDGAFNTILNSITSQGYDLMELQPFYYQYLDVAQNLSFGYSKLFLAEPWTTTSAELERANSSQIGITNVYPNPSKGMIQVAYECNHRNGPLTLVIYDSKGIVVHKQKLKNLGSGKVAFDSSKLAAGEYFVTLIDKKFYCEANKILIKP